MCFHRRFLGRFPSQEQIESDLELCRRDGPVDALDRIQAWKEILLRRIEECEIDPEVHAY